MAYSARMLTGIKKFKNRSSRNHYILQKMELIKTEIAEVAGKIISESGLDALTTEELAKKMRIDHEILYIYFKNNVDILSFLIQNLEYEIRVLINDLETKNVSPEKELQLLFENMYRLFEQKPYYLSIIFIIEDKEKADRGHEILISIKSTINKYLLKIINQGKKETIFKTKQTPWTLVNNILGSFRSFMNQQNIINKMVRDIKKLRDNPEYLDES